MPTDQRDKHLYFDPEPPAIPQEVLGIPAQPLINLGWAAGGILMESSKPSGYHARYSTPHAIRLFPLLEKIQAGDEVSAEAVRPYRKTIKQLGKLGFIDGVSVLSSGLLVGIPARKALNRKVENDFPLKARGHIQAAGEYLPRLESNIEYLAGLENPREEYLMEIRALKNAIKTQSVHYAELHRHKTPEGIDAAHAIRDELTKILSNDKDAKSTYPLIGHLIINNTPGTFTLPSVEMFSAVAPEIIQSLDSVLPEERDADFYYDVLTHPTTLKHRADTWKPGKVSLFDKELSILLISVRDLLPTNGQEVRDRFERVKSFINSNS